MRVRGTGVSVIVLGALLSLGNPLTVQDAAASPTRHKPLLHATSRHAEPAHAAHYRLIASHRRLPLRAEQIGRNRHRVVHYAGISCVPFARRDSGIALSGNAWQWWDHAAGVYARGQVPEPGSVLAFRSNPRMRLGHVAVVGRIVNRREVEIDQANWWGPGGHYGGVSHNVPVVDVSEANDWTAVRVGLGQPGEFGAVYPTYGFIYDRPDTGVMVASAHAPAPQPVLNPAPRDLRPVAERPWSTFEQVAEAPAVPIDATHRVVIGNGSGALTGGVVGAIDRK